MDPAHRHSIVIAAILLRSFHAPSCVAQPAPTFPVLPSQWTVNISQMGNSLPDHILANTGVIMLHGQLVYGISRIENTGAPFNLDDMVLEGGIRDTGGKWTYQSAADPTEYLLYDFTGEVGDTVIVENPRWGLGPKSLVVMSISPIPVENGTRLQWELAPINGGMLQYWIEGIGSTLGFFGHAFPSDEVATNEQLVCFHESGLLVYRLLSAGECSVINGIVDHQPGPIDLLIHPNPADRQVVLTTNDIPTGMRTRLRVLDMTGRSVLDQERVWSDGRTILDTSELPQGSYAILVEALGIVPVASTIVVQR